MFANVEHFHCPNLAGLTAARNHALQFVRTEYVLFLDDDTEVLSDCVASLKREFLNRPDAVALACSITERWDHSNFRYIFYETVFRRGFFNRRPIKRANGLELRTLPGCAVAVRTSVLLQEPFDEALTGGALGEDFEFSVRARRHGRFWLCDSARVHHYGSDQNRPTRWKERRDAWNHNLYFYDKLHAGRYVWNRLWLAVWMIGESLRWVRLGMGLPPILGALGPRIISKSSFEPKDEESVALSTTAAAKAPGAMQK
jgi:GT2 family glycosyltransferase